MRGILHSSMVLAFYETQKALRGFEHLAKKDTFVKGAQKHSYTPKIRGVWIGKTDL